MTDYADLEIGLHRRDADSYGVELRFSQPGSDADVRLVRGGLALARFDLDRLRALALDDAAYGQLLGENLLADEEVRTVFAQARSTAQALDLGLRLRLFIGPSAPELHSLRWEMLRDPREEDGPLLTGEQLLFSRYLSSLDWRPVRLRSQPELRALVVIASADGRAKAWDARTGALLFVLRGHADAIRYAAWNSDGTRIVTASSDRSAQVWDANVDVDPFTLSVGSGTQRGARTGRAS